MCLWNDLHMGSSLIVFLPVLFSPMTNLSHSFNYFFVVCDIYGVKMKTCVNIKVIIFWLNIVAEFFVRRSVQTSTIKREFAQQGMFRTVFWHMRRCRENSEVHNLQKKRWLSVWSDQASKMSKLSTRPASPAIFVWLERERSMTCRKDWLISDENIRIRNAEKVKNLRARIRCTISIVNNGMGEMKRNFHDEEKHSREWPAQLN